MITVRKYLLKNGKEVSIRFSIPSDAENIISYINRVGGESNYLTFGKNQFPLTVEDEIKHIDSQAQKENCCSIIAVVAGEVISCANVSASDKDRIKHIGTVGISVRKDFWGVGVGKLVMHELIDWAREGGILKKLCLKVREDNVAAIDLYEKLGFVTVGLLVNDFYIDQKYYNCILMELFL
ncbi:MAG: N-acetyltransferase [Bacillales bacterium]|jgi:RimJ/RimL family protein N-acetyltransferase|nr:N-acetyltransferase [Bacillales bacterium]